MEIRRYLLIVRRRLPLVVAIVIAALLAGWLVTPKTKTYTATSTLYVGSRSVDINPLSGQVSGDRVTGLDRLIATFAAMATTRPIAADAVEASGIDRTPEQVIGSTTAQQVVNTDLIDISVTDSDPGHSETLANAVATSLVDQIRAFEPAAARGSASEQVISLYEPATRPGAANPRGLFRNVVLAGLFGVLVAGAVLALLEHLDITLHSAEEVERELDVPVLAVIPALGKHLPIEQSAGVERRAARGPDG
jgi:capsular polysaccharide biosynthesis protein